MSTCDLVVMFYPNRKKAKTLSEPAYMLTVQNIQDYMNYCIDLFADEHPEMLK